MLPSDLARGRRLFREWRTVPNNFFTLGKDGWPVTHASGECARPHDRRQRLLQHGAGHQQAAAIVNYTLMVITIVSVSADSGWDFHPNNRSTQYLGSTITKLERPCRPQKQLRRISKSRRRKVGLSRRIGRHFPSLRSLLVRLAPDRVTVHRRQDITVRICISARLDRSAQITSSARPTTIPSTKEIAPYIQRRLARHVEFRHYDGRTLFLQLGNQHFPQWTSSSQSLPAFPPPRRRGFDATKQPPWPNTTYYRHPSGNGLRSGIASYKFTPEVDWLCHRVRRRAGGGPNSPPEICHCNTTDGVARTLDNYEVGVKTSSVR